MTRIVVAGALANKPDNGGNAWARLSWVLGFKQLGFDVSFVEHITPETCVDAQGNPAPFEECANLAYFREVAERFGVDSAALILGDEERVSGMSRAELRDLADDADILFNMSGHLQMAALRRRFRRSVFFDDDPGFTQFWAEEPNGAARLAGHNYWFTIGENIGTPGCAIPTGGIDWRATRPPVTLADWPVCSDDDPGPFTTVATWRGPYGPVQYEGKTYGLKVHEFRKVMDLPSRVPQRFELALDIHPAETADIEALERNRWRLVDPRPVAGDPCAFRRYVQTSGAEFSVAQGVYVGTGSGWFSDRTTRYLASGKPALVQDTGFSRHYPVGEGLVAFRTVEEAAAGAERIARDYESQARAARALAETYFDSDRVLTRLCEQIDLTP